MVYFEANIHSIFFFISMVSVHTSHTTHQRQKSSLVSVQCKIHNIAQFTVIQFDRTQRHIKRRF